MQLFLLFSILSRQIELAVLVAKVWAELPSWFLLPKLIFRSRRERSDVRCASRPCRKSCLCDTNDIARTSFRAVLSAGEDLLELYNDKLMAFGAVQTMHNVPSLISNFLIFCLFKRMHKARAFVLVVLKTVCEIMSCGIPEQPSGPYLDQTLCEHPVTRPGGPLNRP